MRLEQPSVIKLASTNKEIIKDTRGITLQHQTHGHYIIKKLNRNRRFKKIRLSGGT